jgi:predicted ferric reductase
MQAMLKTFNIANALAIFIGLPLMFYLLGDVPRRSWLKESLSLLTLLSFSLMLGQFYLARSNKPLLSLFKPMAIQKFHKFIAYGAMAVLILHPFFIVLPRYFEAGVKPLDAFIIMITTFDNLGILLGIGAWVLMLILGLTAVFRMRLIKRYKIKYRNWRYFHGGITVIFVTLAIWHAIELGRHTNMAMAIFMIILALVGVAMLARLYWTTNHNTPSVHKVATELNHD